MDEFYKAIIKLSKETIMNQSQVIEAQDAEIARLKSENHKLEIRIRSNEALMRGTTVDKSGEGTGHLSPANQEAVGRLLREIAGHK